MNRPAYWAILSFIGAVGLIGSYYGKSNRHIQLVDIVCNGTEETLGLCDDVLLTPEQIARYNHSHVAGVNCHLMNMTTTNNSVEVICSSLPRLPAVESCHWFCTPILLVVLIVAIVVSVIVNIRSVLNEVAF